MGKEKRTIVTTMVVKDINTKAVLESLKQLRTATIREIAVESGLSIVTVNGIVNTLVSQKKVLTADTIPSGGGRPSQRFSFNERYRLGLLLFTREIGGIDCLCVRVIDLYGRVIDSNDFEVPQVDYDLLDGKIAGMLETYPRIGAIGIGLPGIEFGGSIISGDYHDLNSQPIVRLLTDSFNLPVFLENDVNAAALGSVERPGSSLDRVYIYFPRKYSPGAGIVTNGKLHKGRNHFAGEVSWLPLDITWGPNLIDNFEAFCKAASEVVISLTAVLDPDSVVLFGEHITDYHVSRIRIICKKILPEHVSPDISLSRDFSADFERGLKILTLERLEA